MTSHKLPTKEDPRLIPVWQSPDRVWNGVTIDKKGRFFVSFPSCDGPGMGVGEILPNNTIVPYPDAAWNKVTAPPDANGHFIRINALRIGPDGKLWVVDAGSEGIGAPIVKGGVRLIVIDTDKNAVSDIYDLSPMVKPNSYIDDIRFENDWVYITDAGEPGLGTLNLKTRQIRRMLDHKESTTDLRDMYADGKLLRDKQGKPLRVHADQLEVSPEGKWLYYQPSSGPLYRIETRYLKDETLDDTALESLVELFSNSPTTGGTAIDDQGMIYLNAPDTRQLLRIDPHGKAEVILEDPRLVWADAMWLDRDGWLWIPATQQNLTPGFSGGEMNVNYPVWIYKFQVKAKPPMLDHD